MVLASLAAGAALLLWFLIMALFIDPSLRERTGSWFHLALLAAATFMVLCAVSGIRRLLALCRGRPEPVRLATLRLLLYLLVLAVAANVWLFQPYHRLLALLSIGLGLGLFAAVLTLEAPLRQMLPPRPLRLLDILLLNVCVLLLAGECGLRLFARLRPSPLFARATADSEEWMRQYRKPRGSVRNGFPFNSEGYYDEEFTPGTQEGRVAVVIGDSFSIGVVPHHFHYTTVCERELSGTSVQNRGIASIGPAEYFQIVWREAPAQNPSVVIISLFVGNDVVDSFRWKPPPSLIRTWFDREFLLTCEVTRRLGVLYREWREAGGALIDSAASGPIVSSPEDMVAAWPWLADPLLEKPEFSADMFAGIEQRRALAICRRNDWAFSRLFRVLEQIDLAAHDLPLAFMLIPDEFQVEDAVWEMVVSGVGDVTLERDRPQRLIRQWLEERGIPYLDLLPHLREEPPLPDGRRHLYHLRDTHLNARGNERVGKLLARFLLENGWARPR
ncbi:MAG: hypothetical protein V2A76_16275 [Planctomycetota bacterium]